MKTLYSCHIAYDFDYGLITTSEAAEILGVSLRRVRALIEDGRLPSQQIGREHLIIKSDLELVRERRTGRPPKVKE